ncbi:MAG: hypothetical protein H9533_21740 [Rhodobacteraceae bacterium]|nr:hypothetical protein [Paracoccaceae bacterium]
MLDLMEDPGAQEHLSAGLCRPGCLCRARQQRFAAGVELGDLLFEALARHCGGPVLVA